MKQLIKNCKSLFRAIKNGGGRREYYELKNAMEPGNNSDITNWQVFGSIIYDYNMPKSNCESNIEPIIAHAYWQGNIGDKQLFSIKSFLCTQQMQYFKIWLWLDKNSYELTKHNKELQDLASIYPEKLIIKYWDLEEEIKNTPAEKFKSFFYLKGRPLPAISDDFRLLSLYKYGGLYFDLDIMFCKDIIPLIMHGEFIYAWEKQPYANSAILFLNKKSWNSEYILKKIGKHKSSQPWAIFKYKDKNLKHLTVYPCYMFDPLWNGFTHGMPIQHFEDFFKEFNNDFVKDANINSYKDFFKGIYAYHWHNQWKSSTSKNSYFGLFNQEFNDLIFKQK